MVLQQFGALGGAQVPWVPPTSVLLETWPRKQWD